jgi:SAM-dependent methyltransferase
VLDRTSVIAAGADRVAAAGLADRITVRDADLTLELDEHDHDVLLLCNVVHGFAPDRARSLVTECVRALRPGGTLLLLDTTDQPRGGVVPHVNQAYVRFFDLHLWHTQGGRVYPTATLIRWLVDAGCQVRRIDLPGFPTRMVLVAETPPVVE